MATPLPRNRSSADKKSIYKYAKALAACLKYKRNLLILIKRKGQKLTMLRAIRMDLEHELYENTFKNR